MHRLILHNDDVRDAAENCTSPGQVGLMNGWGVFSTLRVTDGVLFAFERHFARMSRDAKLLHVPFPSQPDWLHGRLLNLVEANHAFNATLRVAVVRNQGGPFEGPASNRTFDLIAFTADLTSWPDSVALAWKPDARHARNPFAGVKVLSWAFNLTWNEEAHDHGFDEVVLLNERGEVSECTSANMFVVEGCQVWTPPLESGCLPGVTRAILLEEVRVPDTRIGEKTLRAADLEQADGVFITSSTRDLLRVRQIEGLNVRQGAQDLCEKLKKAFVDYRKAYVAQAVQRADTNHVVNV